MKRRAKLWRAHFLGLLAQGLAKADRVEEGITEVTQAWLELFRDRENCAAAELHRILGELLIMRATEGTNV